MKTLINFLKEAIVTNKEIQNQYTEMYQTFNKISYGIQEAWNIWDDSITSTYYKGKKKPEEPPIKFQLQWLENEDLDADGYDTKDMCEKFKVKRH